MSSLAQPSSSNAAPQSTPRPRVLLADDSRVVRTTIANHLRERYDVREVADGEACWQAVLLDSSIRVVLTSLHNPKVDGFELLTRMRSSKVQRIRDLPLVVLCGDAEIAERDKASQMGATDFVMKSATAGEFISRLEMLVRLSSTREALVNSQVALESARTVDPDTELLNLPFFDKQTEKLISYSRRSLSDVALICILVELSVPQADASWEVEVEQRIKLVGRAVAASIRLEDIGTRSDRFEFCVATQTSGLSGVLRFAARLRKVLENVEAAGPGVEVWTSIGVSTLSEELRRSAEELRSLAQKRAQQAHRNRSRRIVLGAMEGAPGSVDPQDRGDEGSMDINLALALIRAGRSGDVVPHLARLIEQINPLIRLVRQQKELQAQAGAATSPGQTASASAPAPVSTASAAASITAPDISRRQAHEFEPPTPGVDPRFPR